jgi:hypothetical protein
MDGFPTAVEHFITAHIESLAQLEALVIIRQGRDRTWSCEDLTRQLYIRESECGAILDDLEKRGFIRRCRENAAVFRYEPASTAIDDLIGELAATYQQRRVAVITQIYSKPINKVQTFADAFRFRRPD